MASLAAQLFDEVRPEFLRILGSPHAPIYIDCLNALEIAADQKPEGLSRRETLAIITTTLEELPEEVVDRLNIDEDKFNASDPDKARFILDRLLESRWLEEPPRGDYERVYFFDAHGTAVLHTLRRVATHETVVFTDTLEVVCNILNNPEVFKEQPLANLEASYQNTREGLRELLQIQKSIIRYTNRQLAAESLKENLSLVYDQFIAKVGSTCYAQLVRSQLPSRLLEARRSIADIFSNPKLLDALEFQLREREPEMSETQVRDYVRDRLERLDQSLDKVVPIAELIDKRTAEFARRSFARFRYLQEVASERRQHVQQIFEVVRELGKGRRLFDIDPDTLGLPAMGLMENSLMAGIDSFFTPRNRNLMIDIEPIVEEDESDLHDLCTAEMEANIRETMTVMRANRFVEDILADAERDPEEPITSGNLVLDDEHGIADLIACLLHSEATEAKYDIEPEHQKDTDIMREYDRQADYLLEKFVIERKADEAPQKRRRRRHTLLNSEAG